jgi:tetratricopeptide (TPR) repeat protein
MANENIDALFVNLFNAFVKNDASLFQTLCNENRNQIFQNFKHWQTVPESVRTDPALVQAWASTMMQIAGYFETQGNDQLINILVGNRHTNILTKLQNTYEEAVVMSNQGKYEDSNVIATSILSKLKEIKGPGADMLDAMLYGLKGTNYLHLGNIKAAEDATAYAFKKCLEIGDKNGAAIYKQNLRLILACKVLRSAPNDPLIYFRSEVVRAQKLSDKGNYEWSNKILNELLQKNTTDSWIKYMHSKIYGLMGLNYFRLENRELAKKYSELALQIATQEQDQFGTIIYQSNLTHIQDSKSNQ